MRNALIVGVVVLCAGRGTAQPPQDWKLPKADAQKWVDRVKKVVGRDNWTVTVSGNDITVARDKPTAFVYLAPNSPPNARPAQAGERAVRYVLRFGPRMTTDEYEKLAAVNEASDKEYDRLHAGVKLPHKFDEFVAKTPEEMARVKAFRDAVAKLPRHDLPDLYTPEYGVYFFQTGDGGAGATWVENDNVRAECDHVREVLVKYFGVYDTLAAAGGKGFGRYLRELPR